MEQWQCPYCMSIAKTDQGHWQHLKDAHNDSKGYEAWKTKKKGNEGHICPHCSAPSKTEQGLWQHCKDVHNDSKGYEAWKTKKNGIIEGNLFTCPHCSAPSKTEQGLWQHCKDVHNDSKGYEAWKTKKNGTIEGTNLFSCPHCTSKSNNEQGHWQHQRDSHGDKEGYNDWVKRKREASRDIKKEEAKIEKKEVCPIENCTGIFPHLAALAQHTKDVHGVFLIEQDSLFEMNPEDDDSFKNLKEFKLEVMDLKEQLSKLGSANTIGEFKKEQVECHCIAWKGLLLIESILRKIARILSFDKPGGTWGNYLSYLKLIGFIQPDLYSTLWDLKMLRNVISHSDDVLVNTRKTEVILKTSQDILSVIENYKLNNKTK